MHVALQHIAATHDVGLHVCLATLVFQDSLINAMYIQIYIYIYV